MNTLWCVGGMKSRDLYFRMRTIHVHCMCNVCMNNNNNRRHNTTAGTVL